MNEEPPAPLPDAEKPALIIFGGGGQGKTLIDLVRTLGSYRVAGIVDDGLAAGQQVLGVPVLGGSADLTKIFDQGIRLAANAVGGINNVDVRIAVFEKLKKAGFVFPRLVHPSVVVEPSAVIEDGVQILPLSYIGSAARVGFGTLINSHVIVSHDCAIGQVVNLSPGAMLAGGVQVGDYAQIGMGVTINVNLHIGSRARVANGATVKKNVPPGERVYAGAVWPPRTTE